jgi:hypothetical protein
LNLLLIILNYPSMRVKGWAGSETLQLRRLENRRRTGAIRRKIRHDPQTSLELAGRAPPGPEGLPVRHLLALEREAHIALALSGGQTAGTVLRSALTVYGNPDSQIYQLEESRRHTKALLQHLSVLIRGYARVGKSEDSALLKSVSERQDGFLALGEGPQHAALVRRVLGWLEAARNEIGRRT